MKARDIMTPYAITVTPQASVVDAARLMLEANISGLPVVDTRGKLVGMITEGDLLRRPETGTERKRPRWLEFILGPSRAAQEFAHTHGRKVSEVMTEDPLSVVEDTPIEDVVKLMERKQLKRVPVMHGETVAGLISRANLVAALVKAAKFAPAVAAEDRRIRDEILAEMNKASWAPVATVTVIVENGAVTLSGEIFDENTRSALVVLAENVSGVKSVRDELLEIEPISGFVFSPASATAEATSQ